VRAAAANSWGTEAKPFWVTEDLQGPKAGADMFLDQQLMGMGEQSIFVMTLVTRDGRVSEVKLLDGDSKTAAPIMDEIKMQRCLPGVDRAGRPVATRAFRLISSMEVRAPRT